MSHDHSHSHGPGEACDHGHDDHNSPEYIHKTIRKYLKVGGILFAGTILLPATMLSNAASAATRRRHSCANSTSRCARRERSTSGTCKRGKKKSVRGPARKYCTCATRTY